MSWFDKLKDALSKTSGSISSKINDVLYKRAIDKESLAELEDVLISSDMGAGTSNVIIQKLGALKFEKDVSLEVIKNTIANIIEEELSHTQKEFKIESERLNVVVMCGVNGNGKTTTIGKLAKMYNLEGKKVVVAACDTFRAAAQEQMTHWANKSDAHIIVGNAKKDPASVAYEAMEYAIKNQADILFIDTAGRLQTQANLMQELTKITKVIKKIDSSAPHHTLLVLDATTGQNAISQVKAFKEAADITGLVVTKLDGTARAGVVVALSRMFDIPIHFIGIGESESDLRPFIASEFANNLVR